MEYCPVGAKGVVDNLARGEARLNSSSSSEDEDERSVKMDEDTDEVLVLVLHQTGPVGGFTRNLLVSLWHVQIQLDRDF